MTYPAPLLQPDPHDGCVYYAVAYICHCFGCAEVTPEQVQAFRKQHNKHEGMFPELQCGLQQERFWHYLRLSKEERLLFWLGPGTRPWVEQHFDKGQIGLVTVERVKGIAHAIVALESRGDDGVYIMDPLYGHRVESWDWFLGIGPGTHGCHHIEGWYSRPQQEQQ